MACRLALAGLLTAGLAAAGCEHAEALGPEIPPTPTLSAVQEQVFSRSCALSGCHAGGSAALGLDLSEGQAHAATVGVRSLEVPALLLVRPGQPDASYLLMKMRGDPGIVGAVMPLGAPPLSAEALALVADWIEAGAPND